MKICCTGIQKAFGRHSALEDISFSVDLAQTLALVGPSGSGKSTLLRILAGLEVPDAGSVTLGEAPMVFQEDWLRRHRLRSGIVFQDYNLFPHLTAMENVLLPLEKVHRFSDARDRAHEALRRFHLASHSDKKPFELSGGQRQRVAIARALAADPKLLFMDEPTAALDPQMTAEILDVIASLRNSGQPLMLLTHEMGFAREAADFVVFIDAGRAIECSPAEAFFSKPASAEARGFLDSVLKFSHAFPEHLPGG